MSSELRDEHLSSIELVTTATRVLVAEDDHALRGLIVEGLVEAGYEVEDVANGRALVDRLAAAILDDPCELPEVLVTDVRMPGVTGLSVLAGMRGSWWRVPTILITGFGDRDLHMAARSLGAVAVIDKPFKIATLISAVYAVRAPLCWDVAKPSPEDPEG